eukprot:m.163705 g.163705  ORF g.163705 m.163705 type:complete len:1485 (-) comp17116_c0_seq1:220-4674(-)
MQGMLVGALSQAAALVRCRLLLVAPLSTNAPTHGVAVSRRMFHRAAVAGSTGARKAGGGGGGGSGKGTVTLSELLGDSDGDGDSSGDDRRERERERPSAGLHGKAAAAAAAAAEPQRVEIISAGYDLTKWTGKTPATLLNELCQRSTWNRPGFDIRERGKGWSGGVGLSKKDKKTSENIRKYYSDKRVYATENEARHFTAVYALHNVAFDKPMHLMMPPGYRDYWLQLERERMAHPKKRLVTVCPDPFEEPAPPPRTSVTNKAALAKAARIDDLPVVVMNEQCRKMVDDALHASVGFQEDSSAPPLTDAARAQLVAELKGMGFRQAHAEEALQYVRSKTSALDWLCMHVPEDDLPVHLRPKSVEFSAAQHNPESLAREYEARKLMAYGFALEECMSALSLSGDNAPAAIHQLLVDIEAAALPPGSSSATQVDSSALSQAAEAREQELSALSSIFEDACVVDTDARTGDTHISIAVETKAPGVSKLHVWLPSFCAYPLDSPVVALFNTSLPVYLRQAAHSALAALCTQNAGEPCIFQLVDWVRDELPELLAKPPSLVEMRAKQSPFVGLNLQNGEHSDKKVPSGRGGQRGRPQQRDSAADSALLLQRMERAAEQTEFKKMQAVRQKLPSYSLRDAVLATIKKSQVTIVCGETGCGKTTQVPQFLLEDMVAQGMGGKCNIVCTQPRRLSAIAVAQRVAAERVEETGDVVGYAVRLETKQSAKTRLLFCTTGVLLRQLHSDPQLSHITHILVDEVHERSVDSDVLLAVLKGLLSKRRDLKLVLMSATLDSARFSSYFQGAPVLEIPGFTHPVTDYFLEDVVAMTGYQLPPLPRSRGKQNGGKGAASAASKPALSSGKASTSSLPQQQQASSGKAPAAASPVEDWEDRDTKDGDDNNGSDGDDDDEDGPDREAVDAAAAALELEQAEDAAASAVQDAADEDFQAQLSQSEASINYELIAALVAHICVTDKDEGGILIFLPGIAEIKRCMREVQGLPGLPCTLEVLPLHSSVSPSEQTRVFQRMGARRRKVIVSTNIAETSITIDDVTHVIDAGRVKEMQYDSINAMSCLADTWIAKANARQRRGRAGRTRPGKCYKIYSRGRFDKMADQQTPEILRVPLDQLCLQIMTTQPQPVGQFLASMLDRPAAVSVEAALQSLRDVQALDAKNALTGLGSHIAQMPADVRVSKLLLFGAILRCVDPILTIAACMSYRSPLVSPFERRAEAKAAHRRFGMGKSDLLAFDRAFTLWAEARQNGRAAERDFCEQNFVSSQTMFEISELRKQLLSSLADAGFVPKEAASSTKGQHQLGGQSLNACSDNAKIIKAALCAGLYPNVARVRHPPKVFTQTENGTVVADFKSQEIKLFLKDRSRVFLHPSSLLFDEGRFEDPHLLFHQKVATSKVFLRDGTMVSAYALLLFGGRISVNHNDNLLAVDDWLQFRAPARIAVACEKLRSGLDAVLRGKVDRPGLDISACEIVRAITHLLATDGM